MFSSEILHPDFTVAEHMANSDSLHTLSMYHDTQKTIALIEGVKRKENPPELRVPYVCFSWRTNLTAEEAATLIDQADELPGVNIGGGTFRTIGPEGHFEYAWIPSDDEEPTGIGVSDLDLSEVGLVRLDVEDLGAIVWHEGILDTSRVTMGVITNHDIQSPWVREVYDRTVEDETRAVVNRHIGSLATVLTTFLQTPFGEPVLEEGFTPYI